MHALKFTCTCTFIIIDFHYIRFNKKTKALIQCSVASVCSYLVVETKHLFSFLASEKIDEHLFAVPLMHQLQVTLVRRSRRLVTARHLDLVRTDLRNAMQNI